MKSPKKRHNKGSGATDYRITGKEFSNIKQVYFGWYVSRDVVVAEMRLYHGVKPWNIFAYRFLIRWFIPIIILLIFLNGIGVISL